MGWKSVCAVVGLGLAASGCPGDDGGCSSDSECGTGLVCHRAAGACVEPPAECLAACSMQSTCEATVLDTCIKNSCGASFLQYYGTTFGADCEAAWLDLMQCEAGLSCADWARYSAEVDPAAGTAPFCQTQLQAKNGAC